MSICPHHLVKYVVECHQRIPSNGNGGWSSDGHDFERIVDVCIECVVDSTVYVACFVIVVFWCWKVAMIHSVCLHVYGTIRPSMALTSRNSGTPELFGRLSSFMSKGVGSMSEYIAGLSTNPPYPLTLD